MLKVSRDEAINNKQQFYNSPIRWQILSAEHPAIIKPIR